MVLFADRSLEPKQLAPYQPLLDAGSVRRFYLDELPETANAPLGLSILNLIRQTEDQAPAKARELIGRARLEIVDEALRDDLIELIETVIIYRLPRLSREEIQTMLQIHDIRESRVYQEAKEEGAKETTAKVIAKMASRKMPAEEIAAILEIDIEEVREAMKIINGTP